MTLPAMCAHHASVYATRAARLSRIRHPGTGRKALAREAELVGRQCRECPEREWFP